ncbi:hypothetical protein FOA52_005160 [Chlamydomonas sp. UWO 241]|nr:hypothetical protein FOA52_005160 [Chlamydomonas sp. UWO 241]
MGSISALRAALEAACLAPEGPCTTKEAQAFRETAHKLDAFRQQQARRPGRRTPGASNDLVWLQAMEAGRARERAGVSIGSTSTSASDNAAAAGGEGGPAPSQGSAAPPFPPYPSAAATDSATARKQLASLAAFARAAPPPPLPAATTQQLVQLLQEAGCSLVPLDHVSALQGTALRTELETLAAAHTHAWEVRRLLAARDCAPSAFELAGGAGASSRGCGTHVQRWCAVLRLDLRELVVAAAAAAPQPCPGHRPHGGTGGAGAGAQHAGHHQVCAAPGARAAVARARKELLLVVHPDKVALGGDASPATRALAAQAFQFLEVAADGLVAHLRTLG